MAISPENVELLAPAGCYASLQAAIDAGADSVYFGLSQLNMRARARRSFDIKDLPEICQRSHDADVKTCLTLNTILYDHDLPMTGRIMDEAAKQNVSAVIVSDPASIQMALERDLEVHLSTQLSISNYEAIKFYANMCDRVVLARELNMTMMRRIHEKMLADDLRGRSGRPMEIEAFAHGAMCIAVSGRCGMSLFTSNGSANRGGCEQNCRKSYDVIDKETGQALTVDNEYIMSPSDICTIDFLDQMLESGVQVLKIEGRGRAPEYVKTVIGGYRRALNAIQDGSYGPELIETLMGDMKSVYNRGLASGYYLGRKQGYSAAYGSKATERKIDVGRVSHFYDRISVADIKLQGMDIQAGDKLLIIGGTTGVVEVKAENMRLSDESTSDTVAKGQLFSLKVPSKVRPNDRVYKMQPIS